MGRRVYTRSRLASAALASVAVTVLLGCMGISIGGRYELPRETAADCGDVLTQEGSVSLRSGGEQEVYYPVPYAFPPNLEFPTAPSWVQVVEQKADHFRVKCDAGCSQMWVSWKARGVKYSAPPAPPPLQAPAAVGVPQAAPEPAIITPPDTNTPSAAPRFLAWRPRRA
jgi:hypothetical protein